MGGGERPGGRVVCDVLDVVEVNNMRTVKSWPRTDTDFMLPLEVGLGCRGARRNQMTRKEECKEMRQIIG